MLLIRQTLISAPLLNSYIYYRTFVIIQTEGISSIGEVVASSLLHCSEDLAVSVDCGRSNPRSGSSQIKLKVTSQFISFSFPSMYTDPQCSELCKLFGSIEAHRLNPAFSSVWPRTVTKPSPWSRLRNPMNAYCDLVAANSDPSFRKSFATASDSAMELIIAKWPPSSSQVSSALLHVADSVCNLWIPTPDVYLRFFHRCCLFLQIYFIDKLPILHTCNHRVWFHRMPLRC